MAPSLGGVMGAGLYKALVELHHPKLETHQSDRREQDEMDSLEKHKASYTDTCV